MGPQSFGTGKGDAGRPDSAQAVGICRDGRGPLEKVENRKTRSKARRAAGRQNMVGSAHIVADGFGAVASEEHGASVTDLRRKPFRIVEHHFEMFRREAVGDLGRLGPVAHDDDGTVIGPGFAGNCGARQVSNSFSTASTTLLAKLASSVISTA